MAITVISKTTAQQLPTMSSAPAWQRAFKGQVTVRWENA
jgi:hypothetical protein